MKQQVSLTKRFAAFFDAENDSIRIYHEWKKVLFLSNMYLSPKLSLRISYFFVKTRNYIVLLF